MQGFDKLINDWAEETMEEGWWVNMEADLARLVRRAYCKGVTDALGSLPVQDGTAQEMVRRNTTRTVLCDLAAAWEDWVAHHVTPEGGRGIRPEQAALREEEVARRER